MTLFEAVRIAALVLEPQIAIMCAACYIGAKWRRVYSINPLIVIPCVLSAIAMAVNVLIFSDGVALLISLILQEVTVIWWLVSLIRGIRQREEWEARIECHRQIEEGVGYRMVVK